MLVELVVLPGVLVVGWLLLGFVWSTLLFCWFWFGLLVLFVWLCRFLMVFVFELMVVLMCLVCLSDLGMFILFGLVFCLGFVCLCLWLK